MLGRVGVDNTGTMYVCTAGGSPGTWVAVGAGGGGAGAPVVRKFPFAFNTPGILTGAAVYTPTVNDVLLDAWVEVDTAWNGTTPEGDVGSFNGAATGLYASAGFGPIDMTKADQDITGSYGLLISNNTSGAGTYPSLALSLAQSTAAIPAYPAFSPFRAVPGKFTAAHPVKVCVSQDGTNTGANPGSTQGEAILYLVTATPA
jgi:hypothetical protein